MADIPKPLYLIGDRVIVLCNGDEQRYRQGVIKCSKYLNDTWIYRICTGSQNQYHIYEADIVEKLVDV